MGTLFDWHGFDTFITDATLPDPNKHEIMYIFAKKLSGITSVSYFYYRFINDIVETLNADASIPTKSFYAKWKTFDTNIKGNQTLINDIAEKLLVVSSLHNNLTNVPDATAALATIPTIQTSTTFTPPITQKDAIAALRDIDNSSPFTEIKNHHKTLIHDWKGFDTIIGKINDKGAKLYTAKYFASQITSYDEDSYLRIDKLLTENEKLKKELGDFKKEVNADNTLLTNNRDKLLFLFENTNLENDIDKKLGLKCLKSETSATPLVFNPDDMSITKWTNYKLMNILSYDINGLGTNATNIDNVATFINDILQSTAPYNKFKPVAITLQNTEDLVGSTQYGAIQTTAANNGYKLYVTSDNKLITFINDDYKIKNDIKGFIDPGTNQINFQLFNIDKFNISIVNIINPTTTPISFERLNNNCIKQIDKKHKILIAIGGSFDNKSSSPIFITNYEKSACKYNGKTVNNVYILSRDFEDDVSTYDFHETKTAFDTNYVASMPVGKRLFFTMSSRPTKATTPPKGTGPVIPLKNMYDSLLTSIQTLNDKELTDLLYNIRPPTISKKKAVTRVSSTSKKVPAPTKVSSTNKGAKPATAAPKFVDGAVLINNIYSIDFTGIPGFNKDTYKTEIKDKDYTLVAYTNKKDASKPYPKKFKVKIDTGNLITIDSIYQHNKTKTKYYIKVIKKGSPDETYYIPLKLDSDKAINFKIDINGTTTDVPQQNSKNMYYVNSFNLHDASTAAPAFTGAILDSTKALDAKYELTNKKTPKIVKITVDGTGTQVDAKLYKAKDNQSFALVYENPAGTKFNIQNINFNKSDNMIIWDDGKKPSTIFDLTPYMTS